MEWNYTMYMTEIQLFEMHFGEEFGKVVLWFDVIQSRMKLIGYLGLLSCASIVTVCQYSKEKPIAASFSSTKYSCSPSLLLFVF